MPNRSRELIYDMSETHGRDRVLIRADKSKESTVMCCECRVGMTRDLFHANGGCVDCGHHWAEVVNVKGD